jgi:hypothetical protein
MWICDALSGFVELSHELTVVKKKIGEYVIHFSIC